VQIFFFSHVHVIYKCVYVCVCVCVCVVKHLKYHEASRHHDQKAV
jgi:hypothetical protein